MQQPEFSSLVGRTLTAIAVSEHKDEITFSCSDGKQYKLHHVSDCCEVVTVNDVCGDLEHLLNTPILQAEESTNSESDPPGVAPGYRESFTWTFYRMATIKGSVVIRWLGESNGYYSESVSFSEI